MSSSRGFLPLTFRRIGRADLGCVLLLQLERVERYLEPLPEIVEAVRAGASHSMIGIEADGALVGFYVVHPDRRDRACWWLGWLAIDVRWQGSGFGRAAMQAVMARLRRVVGCRRVRLLVAAENGAALRLYRDAGFVAAGRSAATGELVLERVQALGVEDEPAGRVVNAYSLVQAMELRLWRRGVPAAARMSGEFHGPPASTWFMGRCAFPATM